MINGSDSVELDHLAIGSGSVQFLEARKKMQVSNHLKQLTEFDHLLSGQDPPGGESKITDASHDNPNGDLLQAMNILESRADATTSKTMLTLAPPTKPTLHKPQLGNRGPLNMDLAPLTAGNPSITRALYPQVQPSRRFIKIGKMLSVRESERLLQM